MYVMYVHNELFSIIYFVCTVIQYTWPIIVTVCQYQILNSASYSADLQLENYLVVRSLK